MTTLGSMTPQTVPPQSMADIKRQPEVAGGPVQPPAEVNVAIKERELSLIGGAGLLLFGLSRGSFNGLLLAGIGGALVHRAVTGHCSMYGLLNINSATKDEPAAPEEYFQRGIHVEVTTTINRSPADLFRFWRNFENLPQFMKHLKAVEVKDDKHSRWIADAPAGMTVQWDAEIINEEQDALIAWRSTGNAEVDNAGSVRFLPAQGDRGTEVHVVLDYIPPAGTVGSWIAKLFGKDPEAQIREDLRRFKQLMETGEIPTTQGQPSGSGGM